MHQLIMSRSSATRPSCTWILGVRLGVRVGRVRMAHVARDARWCCRARRRCGRPRSRPAPRARSRPSTARRPASVTCAVGLALDHADQRLVVGGGLQRVALALLGLPVDVGILAQPLGHQRAGDRGARRALAATVTVVLPSHSMTSTSAWRPRRPAARSLLAAVRRRLGGSSPRRESFGGAAGQRAERRSGERASAQASRSWSHGYRLPPQ